MRIFGPSVLLLLLVSLGLKCGNWKLHAGSLEDVGAARAVCYVTNVAQFRSLPASEYLESCDFSLTGVVTLVDTNRQLVVLQDETGAVALNFRFGALKLEPGLRVCLAGSNCCPYFPGYPDYPYRPSGWNVSQSFEAPMNWGEYHLTRMRGYLHAPVTGEYTFWVASDNSSELWLSPDEHASRARKICSIPRFSWTAPREWSKFASQRSGPILLKAGETYYIEALAEQTTIGENLAVAWQGPGLDQAVIEASYLRPWGPFGNGTNGILREYWTNFSAGDLTEVAGARPFESALSVEKVQASVLGPGPVPKPDPIKLDASLRPENNYRWVQAEGRVKFSAADEDGAFLELSDGRAQVQVRVPVWTPELTQQIRNTPVRVQGVCEGVYDEKGVLAPGLIWATSTNGVALIETGTNLSTEAMEQPSLASLTKTNPAMQGFYGTRGVVTFNERVFGKDYLFVQENTLAVLVSLEGVHLKNQLKVGQWVDLGGALQPSESVPVLRPLVVTELGWHSMPMPITQPLGLSVPANREGRWNELEGVVHTVNTNGTVSFVGKDGLAYLWLGQTPSNSLPGYVDAKLRARGVLLLAGLDAPVLLVPSRAFVDIEEPAPSAPFAIPRRPIASLHPEIMESLWPHRARIAGELTYRDTQSFFIQDNSGGIRVRCATPPKVQEGETIEVLGFPTLNGLVRTLTEPVVRLAGDIDHIRPRDLDVSEAMSTKQSGNLVNLTATFLGRKTNGPVQVLELQEQQRVFSAMLSAEQGTLPEIAAGSRLRVTGVCDNEATGGQLAGDKPNGAQFLASLNISLRSPLDVRVLSGPPWWTWRRTATLVGALLTVLLVTLLWVHLLRRRLERQHAAQLAFSRQVLERLEDERRRIAVNLHDSLGQILVAIKHHALLAIQRDADGQGLRVRLDEISGATSQAIEEVRQITHGLRPYQLDRLGLTQAIRASVSRASANSSILFASRVEDIDGLFDKDAEIHVYRIVQEAVTNVVKHSAATEAAVVIKKKPGVVSLSIRDNGKGFDPVKPSSQPHDLGYGLSGIAERVRILGGTLTIDSRPGQGSSVSVEVPLPVSKV
jgi:signal transduction histidine kinase